MKLDVVSVELIYQCKFNCSMHLQKHEKNIDNLFNIITLSQSKLYIYIYILQ